MFGFQAQIARKSSHGNRTYSALAALVLMGCASSGGPSPLPVGAAETGDAYLTVTNRHPHHVEIVVLSERRSTVRMGTVRVQASRELLFPRPLLNQPVQLLVRCLETGEVHETRELVWESKDRLDLLVLDPMTLTRLALQ